MKKTKTIKQKKQQEDEYCIPEHPLPTYHACPICGAEMIWGGDHDIEDESNEYTIVSNMSCTNEECGAFVEVYHQKKEKQSKRKVQYQSGMVSCAGVEHINPDTEEIDFESTVEEIYIDPSEEEIDFD